MRCERCPVRSGEACVGEAHPAICARAADPAEAGFRGRLARRRTAAAFPPLAERAANLAGAVVSAAATRGKRVGPEERARRLATCNACPELVDGRCLQCGCATAWKAKLEAWHCPIDKW